MSGLGTLAQKTLLQIFENSPGHLHLFQRLTVFQYLAFAFSVCSYLQSDTQKFFFFRANKQINLCPMVWALWAWSQRLCPYFTDTTHLREAKGAWGEGKALKIEAIKLRNCLAFVQKDDLYWLVEHKTIAKVTVCQPDIGVDNNLVSARLHWS